MSTMTRTDALARIRELEAEANKIQQEADEKLGKIFAEMRDVSNAASGAYQVHSNGAKTQAPSVATASTPMAVKRRGRPKGSGKAAVAKSDAVAVKRRGRPKGSGKAATATATATANDRNYSNDKPLREVIWEVMSRNKRSWKKSLPDLPDDATGLKAVEIAAIIEQEGLWSSASVSSVATQISNHIKEFKNVGKVIRGDHARYEIVDGAKLED